MTQEERTLEYLQRELDRLIYLTYNADNAPDREAARVACFKILEKIETILKD